MAYVRKFVAQHAAWLEQYERIQTETGLTGELLNRAFDDWVMSQIKPKVQKKRAYVPPPPKPKVMDEVVKDRIKKLRSRASALRAVGEGRKKEFPAEAAEFLSKAKAIEAEINALIDKYMR